MKWLIGCGDNLSPLAPSSEPTSVHAVLSLPRVRKPSGSCLPAPKHPFPAMIVPFGVPDEPLPGVYAMPAERIQAVHLTYLQPDGSGKAPVDPQRRVIGTAQGLTARTHPAQ